MTNNTDDVDMNNMTNNTNDDDMNNKAKHCKVSTPMATIVHEYSRKPPADRRARC